MDAKSETFLEFGAYWKLSEKLVADATKEDLAEAARILAMQVAHFTRKYGELELPDMQPLLSLTQLDEDSVALLKDGTEAMVGVLGVVMGLGGVDIDETLH